MTRTNPPSNQLALLPSGAVVCSACGGVSPSPWHAEIGHTIMPGNSRCMAQWLVLNHIAYYRQHGTPEQLAERIARARDLRLTEEDWA